MDLCLGSWILVLCGFLAVGFLAALETAYMGVPRAKLEQAILHKDQGAKQLVFWLRSPAWVLGTFQLLRVLCLLVVGWAFARCLYDAPPSEVCIWLMLGAVFGLLVGHLLPRSCAKEHAWFLAVRSSWFVQGLVWLCSPIVVPLLWCAQKILRRVLREQSTNPFWTADELHALGEEARAESLGASSEALLMSIIEFSDTIIREIMVPRTDMIAVSAECNRSELTQSVLEGGHSRIPVYSETIDNIIGVLHVKDWFIGDLKQGEFPALKKIMRPTFFVPEVMKISELLREFQRRKTHLAIVVDEYGGTAGVVTLEDILEEIVGDIQDEYDVDDKQFRVISETKLLADGRVNIHELGEAMNVSFPDNADYETLAGFLMHVSGSMPEKGAVFHYAGWRLLVKDANEKRIGTVEVERV